MVTASPVAIPAAVLAELGSEMSALMGTMPKVAIGTACGTVGAMEELVHGFEAARHVDERARPSLGFGL